MHVPLLIMRRVGISKPTLNPDYCLILLLKAQKKRTSIYENVFIGWGLLLSPKFRNIFKNIEKIYPKENWPARKRKFILLSFAQLTFLMAISFTGFRSFSHKAIAWNTIDIKKGSTGFVILPDSSTVNLNASSLLQVSTEYNKVPLILLDGEGYFKFKPDSRKKAVIKIGTAEITTGANALNVSNYDDNLFIACFESAASVKIKNGDEIYLNPGIALIYDFGNGSLTTVNIDQDTVTSWIRGIYYIDEEKLESICKRIERVYNTKIAFDRPVCKNCSFSGQFRKEDPINVILENLSQSGGMKYFRDESGVVHWH